MEQSWQALTVRAMRQTVMATEETVRTTHGTVMASTKTISENHLILETAGRSLCILLRHEVNFGQLLYCFIQIPKTQSGCQKDHV
jgi:hypothetical protein